MVPRSLPCHPSTPWCHSYCTGPAANPDADPYSTVTDPASASPEVIVRRPHHQIRKPILVEVPRGQPTRPNGPPALACPGPIHTRSQLTARPRLVDNPERRPVQHRHRPRIRVDPKSLSGAPTTRSARPSPLKSPRADVDFARLNEYEPSTPPDEVIRTARDLPLPSTRETDSLPVVVAASPLTCPPPRLHRGTRRRRHPRGDRGEPGGGSTWSRAARSSTEKRRAVALDGASRGVRDVRGRAGRCVTTGRRRRGYERDCGKV